MGDGASRRLPWSIVMWAASLAVSGLHSVLGWPGAVGIAALVAVAAMAYWIRGLHPESGLREYASRFFLVAAGVVMVVGAFTPAKLYAVVTVLALVLALGAAMVAKTLKAAARLLAGSASIGAGMMLGGYAITAWNPWSSPLFLAWAAVYIALGAAFIGDRHALARGASIAFGAVLAAFGIALVIVGKAEGFGLVIAGMTITLLQSAISNVEIRRGIRYFLMGTAYCGLGALLEVARTVLPAVGHQARLDEVAGALTIVAGVAAMVHGVTRMAKRHTAARTARIVLGAALLVQGAVWFAADPASGAAAVLRGGALLALVAVGIGPEYFVRRVQEIGEWATQPRDTV